MKHINILSIAALLQIVVLSCKTGNKQPSIILQNAAQVTATFETTPVQSVLGADAADDPAIYINPVDSTQNWVIGTNKKAGLGIYNMQGEEIHFAPVGLVNNVDLRYHFQLADSSYVDLVGASNRTDNSITLWTINPDSASFGEILAAPIISKVDEVYGFCMHYSERTNTHYAFVNGKDGQIEQWELIATEDNKIRGKKVNVFRVESQPEGMVVDDANEILYVGEEAEGVWRFELNAAKEPALIETATLSNKNLAADIEGISIFYGKEPNTGYLLVSSQGNFSYAVFDRMPPNAYLGSFQVCNSEHIDGTQETDGLEVLNYPISADFPHGVFVAQDGFNYDGDSLRTQNFKYVAWEDIAKLFDPQLIID